MPTPETIRLWLQIAKDDLKSARILYQHKQYRTAYFYFQQASEKASKAMALKFGIFEEKKLMDIRHNQMEIYHEILKVARDKFYTALEKGKFKNLKKEEVAKGFSDLPLKLVQTLKHINNLYSKDLVNIPTADLNDYIDDVYEIQEIFDDIYADRSEKGREERIRIMMGIVGMQPDEHPWNALLALDAPQQAKMSGILSRMIRDTITAMFSLYCCALVTIQHSSRTRYPSAGVNPLKIYRGNLPIVRKLPEFLDLLEDTLTILTRL